MPRWERALRLVGGIFFMILGVVGWLVPIVTGIPFYIIGLFLLASVSPPARRFVNWLDRKLPRRARLLLRRRRRKPDDGENDAPPV